jgi:hypothetical protein
VAPAPHNGRRRLDSASTKLDSEGGREGGRLGARLRPTATHTSWPQGREHGPSPPPVRL